MNEFFQEPKGMKRLLEHTRFAVLALALSIVPLVRSCDDAIGLVDTSGFPLPFTVHTNHNFLFSGVDAKAILIDVVFFLLAAVLFSRLAPAVYRRVGSIRVLAVVVAYGVFCFLFNPFVFVILMAIVVALNSFVELVSSGWGVIDFLARLTLVGVVAIAAFGPSKSVSLRDDDQRSP
jgi:hypothetical protein